MAHGRVTLSYPCLAPVRVRNGERETSEVVDGRRQVVIEYGDGEVDRFDSELFAPDELRSLVGLPCIFERSSVDEPRMVFAFEK